MKLQMHWQILIALVAAILAAVIYPALSGELQSYLIASYAFVGSLFLSALKMIIIPLVTSSIIMGMQSLGDKQALGRMGSKTLLWYASSSLCAILIGLLVVNIAAPGIIDGEPAREQLGLSADTAQVLEKVEGKGGSDIAEIFLRMVPSNLFAAATNGELLGLITFSLIFGFFLAQLHTDAAHSLRNSIQAVYEIMLSITNMIMKFAPLGVFALVAKTLSTTGFEAFRPLATFFFTTLAALAIHAFIALPIALRVIAKVSPSKQFKAIRTPLLTAFSTASSSATLPITMRTLENESGVSKKTTGFVLPLGATINMDGTALYECVAAMFIAQAYGLELSFTTQLIVVITALLTSIGVAGIPSASLVAIAIILGAIGLPLEALGLILVTDRILDMCRTAVNVLSDTCGAMVVAKSEGEKTKVDL